MLRHNEQRVGQRWLVRRAGSVAANLDEVVVIEWSPSGQYVKLCRDACMGHEVWREADELDGVERLNANEVTRWL